MRKEKFEAPMMDLCAAYRDTEQSIKNQELIKSKTGSSIKINDINGYEMEITRDEIDDFIKTLVSNFNSHRSNALGITDMSLRECSIFEALFNGKLYTSGYISDLTTKKLALNALKNCCATYFVACPDAGVIKVGKTKQISKRFGALATGSPLSLKLAHVVLFREDLEGKIHKHLSEYRSHGEWFAASENVIDLIRQTKAKGLGYLVDQVYPR